MAAVTPPVATGASVGSGVLIAWAWNTAVPHAPMPAEVAAVVGAVLVPFFDLVVAVRDAIIVRIEGRTAAQLAAAAAVAAAAEAAPGARPG